MRPNRISFLFMIALFGLNAVVARANMGPCGPDVEANCKGVKAGHGNVMHCLKEAKEKGVKLSDACAAHMDKMHAKWEEMMSACKGDMDKFCAGKEKREAGKCLHEHKKELSDGCKAKMHHKEHGE